MEIKKGSIWSKLLTISAQRNNDNSPPLPTREANLASEEVRRIVKLMQESFYVDDCLSCLSVREQVDEFQMTSCEIMLNASMKLRKWRGNSIMSSEDAGTKVLG